MEGNLERDLAEKWAWAPKDSDKGNSPRMPGNPKELGQIIRSRL